MKSDVVTQFVLSTPSHGPQASTGVYERLYHDVICPGLCTHCGTCAGLAARAIVMAPDEEGPLPAAVQPAHVPPIVYDACPGRGVDYPALNRYVFGELPESWLTGHVCSAYIGFSQDSEVRRRAASGGVITQTLLYLLRQGLIQGAVVVKQGQPKPWLAEPIIARTEAGIIASSQSVYAPVPVNAILAEMDAFEGRLAYVGLPDQVAALRKLQQLGHTAACKVDYVIGPYVGTNLYGAAIESYLRSNGIHDLDEVTELRYREGEWPGYLQVKTRSDRILRTEKFYYNYLIPFFVTHGTLLSVDFTNELTDISVGDAWHPRLETRGGGFSVVLARSARGEELLHAMQTAGEVALAAISTEEALSMHGHMLDFKKRGSFIRMQWRHMMGRAVPEYGYAPVSMPASRYVVELVISSIFAVGRMSLARRVLERLPIALIGPLFNTARKRWKQLSKPVKRKGLATTQYCLIQEVATASRQPGRNERASDER